MFETLVYYGIVGGLAFSAGLVVTTVIARLLGRSHGVWSIAPRPPRPVEDKPVGGFPSRPSEPIEDEDEDDIGGSFTCFFCDTPYVDGAKDCICHGCGRHICLACTYYEEDQTPGGPDGPHTASDHPAYEKHAR